MSGVTKLQRKIVKLLKYYGFFLSTIISSREVGWRILFISYIALSYIASPIDLIPDFIPILGFIDEFLVIPLFIWIIQLLLNPSRKLSIKKQTLKSIRDRHQIMKTKLMYIIVPVTWLIFGACTSYYLVRN